MRGEPAEPRLDVQAYVALLDTTIDAMLRDRHKGMGGDSDSGDTHDDEG